MCILIPFIEEGGYVLLMHTDAFQRRGVVCVIDVVVCAYQWRGGG